MNKLTVALLALTIACSAEVAPSADSSALIDFATVDFDTASYTLAVEFADEIRDQDEFRSLEPFFRFELLDGEVEETYTLRPGMPTFDVSNSEFAEAFSAIPSDVRESLLDGLQPSNVATLDEAMVRPREARGLNVVAEIPFQGNMPR